uniref:Neuroguidin n=1 Tax=Ditylenchus dipsaci TaxID=166011 RepID=A0A915D9Z2_9BILA
MTSTEEDHSTAFTSILKQCSQDSEQMLLETQKFLAYLNEFKQSDKTDGMGLLDVKNLEMVSYITNTLLLMCKMSLAESIEGQDCISRLIKHRTIIEKIRPLESKFNKQIENHLDAKNNEEKANESLQARPDLMLLDSDGESEPDSQQLNQSKLRPLEDMEDQLERAKLHQLKKAKKRASKSSLIRDLKGQLSDRPEEITESGRLGTSSKFKKEKQKYEEDYFVRLQANKKEKHREKRKRQALESASILSFGNYMPPTEDGQQSGGSMRKKMKHGVVANHQLIRAEIGFKNGQLSISSSFFHWPNEIDKISNCKYG